MKSITKILSVSLLAVLMTACFDNVPKVEQLPSDAVSFEYRIVDETYTLDYYVDANIQFTSTSAMAGNATWDFGDGTTATGNEVVKYFEKGGTYTVRLTISDGSKTEFREQPIMVSEIKPIVGVNPVEGGICEVLTSKVNFNIEVPNPKNKELEYLWIFPEGTTDAEGNPKETSTDRLPGDVIFGNVGSQQVRLQVKMGGAPLEETTLNVQVGFNAPVPTLYYAVKGGNIMAYKLIPAADLPEGVKVMPFDLGVSSGQHAFNLCFADSLLLLLDAGKQFNYVNDENGVMGDGKISVIARDGSKVETMITNVGGPAFDDPFYGYVEGNYLYFSNRGTGVRRIGLDERNKIYTAADYPWYFQNATLGYYNNGWSYGSIFGGVTKINGTWYVGKTYNGTGLYRFTDADILSSATAGGEPAPEAGICLNGMSVKAVSYDKKSGAIAFALTNEAGISGPYYCASIADLEGIGSSKKNVANFRMKHESGLTIETITDPGRGEGSSGEFCGITQFAIDETTGLIYFGYRATGSASDCKSGLMYFDPADQKVHTLFEGVEVYGACVNPTPSKLF